MPKLTSRFQKITILFRLSKSQKFLMTTDQCTKQDVEACHPAFPAPASLPRWHYHAAPHPTDISLMPTLVL